MIELDFEQTYTELSIRNVDGLTKFIDEGIEEFKKKSTNRINLSLILSNQFRFLMFKIYTSL